MSFAAGGNPFVEAPAIGSYLHEHTSASDRIAILGSEPEIYFYADRRSATGYVYVYPLMEPQKFAHQMQLDVIHGIETTKPKYLLMIGHPMSWLARETSDRTIFDWYTKTILSGTYTIEAVVDEDHWIAGAEAQTYRPRSRNVVLLFRRRA